MKISVVIPAFNEAGNIGRLVRETYEAVPAGALGAVIVVDDCSSDGTGGELRALVSEYPTLRYLRHDARSGQSAALRTGVLAASTPLIATMDGDGQNDPADIPALLEMIAPPGGDGPALVQGMRTARVGASRKLASKLANTIRDAVLKDNCPDSGCGIKLYWREAFVRLPFFTSMHRFMPALFQIYGHEVVYCPVNDRPRLAGHSKYNDLNRALIGLYDLFGIVWLRRRTRNPGIAEDSSASTE